MIDLKEWLCVFILTNSTLEDKLIETLRKKKLIETSRKSYQRNHEKS